MTGPATGSGFGLLHPRVRQWVADQKWATLRDVQEQAIRPVLNREDVILSAATAAGKTEAAFLPVVTDVLNTEPAPLVLCLSPLKALINDQHRRLRGLGKRVRLDVHRWHGDVPAGPKRKLLANPRGVLLITPESLEAFFVNRGSQTKQTLGNVSHVIVDELHAFLGTARGAQVQSLMNRVELVARRRVPRVALSATLGDMTQAARFLRPTDPRSVVVIEARDKGKGLLMQVRGYAQPGEKDTAAPAERRIADHVFGCTRGSDNLVFANSRRDVEQYTDLLVDLTETRGAPREHWAHHGNLSKSMRETVERRLKDPTAPTTAVCTSTLEMGIDIGTVNTITQVGPPPSVASLRQRLGRSGRRDDPAVLRIYTSESHPTDPGGPLGELRVSTVRTVAMVNLMLSGWLESPTDPGYNYSTLVQQVMSAIAQHSGASPSDLYRALCGPGPFQLVDQKRFVSLLRSMAARELIAQTSDGLLLHGPAGEKQVNHYTFYAAFQTPEEWRLVTSNKTLGTLPIAQPVFLDMRLVFGGKRWQVKQVDTQTRVVQVQPARGGAPPMFTGTPAPVRTAVRQEMLSVYRSDTVPPWLDPAARRLLAEGREAFFRYGLDRAPVIDNGDETMIFPWVGDRALFTMTMGFLSKGVPAGVQGPAVLVETDPGAAGRAVAQLVDGRRPTVNDLAEHIENRELDKWDRVLDQALSKESAGQRLLDIPGAWEALEQVRPLL